LHANPALQKIIDGMEVRCLHEGCNATFPSALRKEHQDSCPFRSVTCPNSELCGIILSKDLDKHLEEDCPERLLDCPYTCGERVKLSLMLNHIKNTCLLVDVDCTCGKKLKRREMVDHLGNECILTPMECEFAAYGCKDKVVRGDFKEHLEKNVQQHMKMLAHTIKLHESEIASLKQKLNNSCALPDLQCMSQALAQAKVFLQQTAPECTRLASLAAGTCCNVIGSVLPSVGNTIRQAKQEYDAKAFATLILLIFLFQIGLPQFVVFPMFYFSCVQIGSALFKSDSQKLIKWTHYWGASFLSIRCCFVLTFFIGLMVVIVAIVVKKGCTGGLFRCGRRRRCDMFK